MLGIIKPLCAVHFQILLLSKPMHFTFDAVIYYKLLHLCCFSSLFTERNNKCTVVSLGGLCLVGQLPKEALDESAPSQYEYIR